MIGLQNNTRVKRLVSCLNDFELGRILILPAHRKFIWKKQHILNFLDSLKKGYPIGAITFWQPDKEGKQTLTIQKNQIIGGYNISQESTDASYILDGYQRLSTFLGCFMNTRDTNLSRQDAVWGKHFNIIYNLDLDIFEFNQKARHDLEIYKIPLSDFLNHDSFVEFNRLIATAPFNDTQKTKLINNYINFVTTLMDYKFASIDLIGGTQEDVKIIFGRMNMTTIFSKIT